MKKTFSSRVKEFRTSLEMTQSDFAASIGSSQNALSGYEKGDRVPSYELLLSISEKYNISLDWLCGLSNNKYLATSISTYDELFRLFINLLETRYDESDNIPIIDIIDTDNESVVLTLHEDINIQKFFTEWYKVFELHCNNTIDDELYNLWIEKELAKYKDHKIDGVPF